MISSPLLLGDEGGYQISRSVRLRSSASAYFNRTPASATNRKTWTWSGWVKRGVLGTAAQWVFTSDAGGTDQNEFNLFFTSSNQLSVSGALTTWRTSTPVYRDPSAWYHIVLVVDTTQATANNRIRLYVNGVEVTAFGTLNNPTLNDDLAINQASQHNIGIRVGNTSPFDGYFTEINFIDGQALTPSSFGETNAVTGVWQPKKYAGTYGTNGFYLNFSDNSTAAALGTDFSGNSNTWTVNNISVTAGVTYDSMVDTPTVSATSSNYAVLNPLYVVPSSTMPTFSDGNLKQTQVGGEGVNTCVSVASMAFPTSGKWYCEVTFVTAATSAPFRTRFGIQADAQINNSMSQNTGKTQCFDYSANGNKGNNNAETAYGNTYTSGDTIGMAVDLDNGKIWWSKNGTFQASGDPAAGTNAAYTTLVGSNNYFTSVGWFATSNINFGQRPFSYTPPTGFVALNTQNLPAPTISNGASYMAATTYTGTGAALTVANTVGSASFQPDLVWVKGRSGATDHAWYDAVRGVQLQLESNTTTDETTETTGLTAFGSTGFTVGALAQMNTSAATYVAWQWNAGGSTVTNTSGSISAQVRANPTAGFSVVTYTGTGSLSTVGHGLGVAPRMIIIKKRSTTGNWSVYHANLTSYTYSLYLNVTNAQASDPNTRGSAPSSSTFSVGTDSDVNANTATYVAYCFAEVAGYSAFGSYTGNGSADGPFVYLGFRPRFVMLKRTDTLGAWDIHDAARDPENVVDQLLEAQNSNAEIAFSPYSLDFLSNGFKLRGNGASQNASGGTFIFAAFAEVPFRSALAR